MCYILKNKVAAHLDIKYIKLAQYSRIKSLLTNNNKDCWLDNCNWKCISFTFYFFRMYHQNSASSVISTCSNSTAGGVTTTGNLEGTTGNISSNNGSAAGNTSISGVREQKISTGSISNKSGSEAISPAVAAAAAAAANDDSESDLEQFTGNRSRQKKFIKNFKQLPQEEVVLQRKY